MRYPRAWTHQLVTRLPGGKWEPIYTGTLDATLRMSGQMFVISIDGEPSKMEQRIRRRRWWHR